MPLDLESLEKAVDTLHRSILIADQNVNTVDPALREVIRAGIIQQFEVAYEQCWKFMQRWLRENSEPLESTHPRSRKELFRLAARHGLVSDPRPWFTFGEVHNLTTHTYDETKAEKGYETAKQFSPHAQELLQKLKQAND